MTTPQEEAERRYPPGYVALSGADRSCVQSQAFVAGTEWLASLLGLTPEQVQRLGPLVEAARAFREAETSAVDSDRSENTWWFTDAEGGRSGGLAGCGGCSR